MVRITGFAPTRTSIRKLEGFNPTGSIKDRIALRMIEEAEQDGRLTPGKTIIEPTSGNTGIGLAIVGIVKGYPVEIVMSSAVSVERRKIIRSYGAKVILTPAEEGTDGAIRYGVRQGGRRPRQIFHARPVCQCGQLPGALPVDGTGNMAADRRQDRLPGLCDRYVGDADGAFAVPEGDEARHQGRLRPADPGPLYPGIEKYGGGYRTRHL